jgi:hypothetical protein
MGRSKKNYDHLVDLYGNYGINIAEGIYPGSGLTPGIKSKGNPVLYRVWEEVHHRVQIPRGNLTHVRWC